jgi:hypothetical protein
MKLPKWLFIVILVAPLVLGILDSVGLGLRFFRILGDIGNFVLVLTLVAVVIYTYYTSQLANYTSQLVKEAWILSASFTLKVYPTASYPPDPYHFAFYVRNHTKFSLNCWCRLNASVYSQDAPLSGFYGGQSSIDLQPYGAAKGHFYIGDILARANRSLEEMERLAGPSNVKDQLRLDIEFWYNRVGVLDIATPNPRQRHYFDFTRRVMVADI